MLAAGENPSLRRYYYKGSNGFIHVRISPLWRHYYQGSHGLIYVADNNNCNQSKDVREELMTMVDDDEMRDAMLLVFTMAVSPLWYTRWGRVSHAHHQRRVNR